MRIALVSTITAPWGGSEELWAEMAEVALQDGHELIASLFHSSSGVAKLAKLQQQGVQVQYRPVPRPGKIGRLTYKFRFSFRRLFQAKPDVILINLGGTYDPLLRVNLSDFFDQLYGSAIPYVVICHSSENIYVLKQAIRDAAIDLFHRAASVLFVSEHNLKTVERQLATALPNARVVRNPVNLSNTEVVPWTPSSTVRLASVARLHVESKGQDVLLEALSLPIWRDRNWQLSLYGHGDERSYLDALVRHYRIGDLVQFCGHLSDIRSVWADNDLLVLPSRREGTPLALVEAMLCGRPAVVTDVGGNAEWIEDAKTGFVAAAPTARSFSAALDRAWQAQADWKAMGLQAHNRAMELFDRDPGRSLLHILLTAAGQSAEPIATPLVPLH